MSERQPFQPDDPMDAMSEMFRRQVTDLALEAYKVTLYRDLNPTQQLQCFLAGALTGVVGVGLASVRTDGADAIMEGITEILPACRQQAEEIANNSNYHDALGSSGERGK